MARRPPVLDWLLHYQRRDLPHDLVAGLLGTLSTAPEAMAFALLAGLPAQMGLYSLMAPLLVYFVLGASRELSLAPTATLAALLEATVAPVAGLDAANYVSVALLVTALVGATLVAARLLRLGFVANFVSLPVLNNYFLGAALLIAASQLGPLLGIEAPGLDVPSIVREVATRWHDVKPTSAALGLGLLALLFLLRALRLHALGPVLAVAVGTLLVATLGLDTPVVGRIPAGLPPLTLPQFGGGAAVRVLEGVFSMSVLVFLDSISLARHYADTRGYRIDDERELLALGASNLVAGLTSAAPVSGNLSDTILLEQAGARSPLPGLVTAVLVLGLVVEEADFRSVPLASFAAIVIFAVVRTPSLARLRTTWRFDRAEFCLGGACLAGVLALGLIRGLLLAVALTVLVLLFRASRPDLKELGFVSAPQPALVALGRVSSAGRLPGALLFQPVGALFFANARAFLDQVRARAREEAKGLRHVVLDFRVISLVDITACDLLSHLERDLAASGVRLVVARASTAILDKLRRYQDLAQRLVVLDSADELLDLLQLPRATRDLT